MATTTPRLGLRKPAGTDLINVTTDISDNMDKIDQFNAGGQLGYQSKANFQGFTSGQGETDISGMAVTINVPAGRRIKISVTSVMKSPTIGAVGVTYLKEGATYLGAINLPINNANIDFTGSTFIVVTPVAGSHTYKLTGGITGGAGSIGGTSAYPMQILVEDIGSA